VTAAPVTLYCYYRVAPEHARAARDAVARAFRAVEERFGITGHLYRGEREASLWMEVYEQAREADRLETMLSELFAASGFAAFLAPGSQRRVERFVAAQ
jgi:hypothetical protein